MFTKHAVRLRCGSHAARARLAAGAGARFELGVEVLAIEQSAAGFRVETSGGAIECERILDAAGTAAGRTEALKQSYP